MPLKRLGGLFLVGIAGLATAIGLLAFPSPTGPAIRQVLMACALYSYMFLVLAALTLPFLKELVTAFGKPFLSIHHTFAALGLAFITLHPVLTPRKAPPPQCLSRPSRVGYFSGPSEAKLPFRFFTWRLWRHSCDEKQ